jgi:hypothetical protein
MSPSLARHTDGKQAGGVQPQRDTGRARTSGVPLRAPELVRLLPPDPALVGELWLVTHPDLRRTARVRAFMETLARGLQRERALLERTAA